MFENVREDIRFKRELYRRRYDLRRGQWVEKTWFQQHLKIYLEPGTMLVLWHRFGKALSRVPIPVFRQLLLLIHQIGQMVLYVMTQSYIVLGAELGKGFVLHDARCVGIPATRIGEYCIVMGQVGVVNVIGRSRPPVIGHHCFLGIGCKILGDVTIGNYVTVGANSVVISSLPDGVTVLGVPARIIARRPVPEGEASSDGGTAEGTDGTPREASE